MATKQKPLHQIRIGSVRASIWEQSSGNGPFLSVSFSRSYKDKSGQWQNGHSYLAHDLEALMDCALEAKEFIRRYRQSSMRVA
ncbi:MAG: hypothetical protein NPIRA01_09770 [Nitrospirales bacterium]|nr:MAG: hypothetical protein NPIRA01_09770 [Nitrospirales bacterium]